MTIIKAFIILLFSISVFGVYAQDQKKTKVYRCVKDGVTIYSQVECENQAQSVVVELDQGLPDKNYQGPYLKQQKQVDDYLYEKQINEQIARHNKNIEHYKQKLASEFTALKEVRFRSDADKDAAVKKLSDKYNGLIKREQEAIKAIYQAQKEKAKVAQKQQN